MRRRMSFNKTQISVPTRYVPEKFSSPQFCFGDKKRVREA